MDNPEIPRIIKVEREVDMVFNLSEMNDEELIELIKEARKVLRTRHKSSGKYHEKLLEMIDIENQYEYDLHVWKTYAVNRVPPLRLTRTLRKMKTYEKLGKTLHTQYKRKIIKALQRFDFETLQSQCCWNDDGVCLWTERPCSFENCPIVKGVI